MTYEIDIAGMKRQLPLCPVTDDLYIGAFVMFGDVELTVHAAAELLKRVPEFDYIVAPEAKSIPLAYEMSRQSGINYLIARKKAKAYMTGVFEVRVQSITTAGEQTLIIDTADAEKIRGKRVLILDDVISTGESLRATEELVNRAGGIIVAKAAVLAEGDAAGRPDLTVLAPLPLFNPDGSVKG
ncbi:MAG: adenine phosphoribosyltransferase [Oscillospiraceae bacterium]|nr:adenine phosphoribosyltransferase [Oscillospiraceae bacterium]